MKIFIQIHGYCLTALLAVLFFGAGWARSAEGYKGFERYNSLITPKELKGLMDKGDSKLVVIAVVKPKSFSGGHLPGARHTWRPDYECPPGDPFPYKGMLLDKARFEKFARDLGVNNDSIVVLYDDKYDATRLWWAFYLYGKQDCRILDGGLQAWKAEVYILRKGEQVPLLSPGSFEASQPSASWVADMYEVCRSKSDSDVQLWDNRETDEWRGTILKKGAFRKGRIPWARFLNWSEFKKKVDSSNKNPTEFKTAAEMRNVINAAGMDPLKRQVFYCQSGVRTTQIMFSLYLLGWDPAGLANYDGSWIEWSYYDKNPIKLD